MEGAAYVQTCYYELRKFKLGPISNIQKDLKKDAEHLKLPPSFGINRNEFVESDKKIKEVWDNLRSEVRELIGILMYAVDIMVDAVSNMDINKIGHNCKVAYTSGWVEPNFTAADNSHLKSKCPIHNQEDYIYCRKTMEGEDTADHDAMVNQQLYEGLKNVLDSNVQMSDKLRAVVESGLNCHKPPDV